MLEESTRLAGEHKGSSLNRTFTSQKINFGCLCVKCTSNNCCAIKKTRDYYFRCLFDKCTCDVMLSTTCNVILSTKVFNITALFASSVGP